MTQRTDFLGITQQHDSVQALHACSSGEYPLDLIVLV